MERSELMRILIGTDTKRGQQKEVGPSEIGGCARKVWHKINGTPKENETLRMAAAYGTAIHSWIESRFDIDDPFQTKFMREVEVSHDGLMGHVDCYDIANEEVIDWKSTTKKNARYFPSDQQITQVQIYGYLMRANLHPVQTVTLVSFLRDGNENDIRFHSEPYSESVALAGVQWLRDVEAMTEPPAPGKHPKFCKDYCEFFGSACGGKS